MARGSFLSSVLLSGLIWGALTVAEWPAVAGAAEESDRLWTVGDQAFQDKLYPLAGRMLERLIDRYPSDPHVPDATLLLGKVRFSRKDYKAALESFKQAQNFSPAPGKPGEARF